MPIPMLPFREAFFAYGDASPFKKRDNEGESAFNEGLPIRLMRFIKMLTQKSALILHLEDVHWADSSTINLLYFVSRNSSSTRVLLVATLRPEDLTQSHDVRVPLGATLVEKRREGLCSEIGLRSLNKAGVKSLSETVLGGKSNPTSWMRPTV